MLAPLAGNPAPRRRSAFTLIETLVATAVVGILAALILAAVQSAREAARRLACTGNLRQLGIAIHAYVDGHGALPRGEMAFSPHTALLPYIEQGPLHDALNISIHSSDADPMNRTVAAVQVGAFVCPSDIPAPGAKRGITNYAMNIGVGYNEYQPKQNGPFSSWYLKDPRTNIAQIIDGMSQTAGVAEWCQGWPRARDARRSTFKTESLIRENQLDLFADTCHDSDPATAPLGIPLKGRNWLLATPGSSTYNHVLTPNGPSCTNGGSPGHGAWTAGSLHPVGANLLFMDGHVAFQKGSIARAPWRALGTMNGSEITTDDP